MLVTIVGSGELVWRLPEICHRPGVHVRALGFEGDPLSRSRFVDEYIAVPQRFPGQTLGVALLEQPGMLDKFEGLICFPDDALPRLLATSALGEAVKVRILPAHTAAGLTMLSSKAGLASLCNRHALKAPRSIVVETLDALPDAVRAFGVPCLLKGDFSGGGDKVLYVGSIDDIKSRRVNPDWLPIVVQEFIEGAEVSVEALFWEGHLVGWLYADMIVTQGRFAPSTCRQFIPPQNRDFEQTLQDLGRLATLHGFFNCSFIRRHATGEHFLIEADPRANAWHPFGPALDVDWMQVLHGFIESGSTTAPVGGPSHAVRAHLFPREVRYALSRPSAIPLLWSWIRRAPGTWDLQPRKDEAINAEELRQLKFAPLQALFVESPRSTWNRIPEGFREPLVRIGLKRRYLRMFDIRV